MKRTSFYSFATPLGGIGVSMLDYEEIFRKEVILKNSFATNNEISKMHLSISSYSVIDEQGKEHRLLSFKDGTDISIFGINTGRHIKSKSRQLSEGRYTHIRFHINPDVSVFLNSSRIAKKAHQDVIDFEIEGGLEISNGRSPELMMRFDLPPFKSTGLMKWMEDTFKYISNFKIGGLRFPSSQGA